MKRRSATDGRPQPAAAARERAARERAALAGARPLPRAFFERPVLRVARATLGRMLVHDSPAGRVVGRVVEVEAYGGTRDPASHAFRGRTLRNAAMFGPAGHAYVYFSYGMHHCLNLVSEREGRAAAVLVRALAPLVGIPLMRRRRGSADWARLGRGPGCVAQALGVDLRHNGLDLTRGPLWLADLAPRREGRPIHAGPRVGIRRGRRRRWRYLLLAHPCVSAPRPSARRRRPLPGSGARLTR